MKLHSLHYFPPLQGDDVCPQCRRVRLGIANPTFDNIEMCVNCWRRAIGDITCIAIESGRNRGLLHIWNWQDWPERVLKSRGYWDRMTHSRLYFRSMTERERNYLKKCTRNMSFSYPTFDALREYEFGQGLIDPKLDTSFNYAILKRYEEQPELDAAMATIRKRKREAKR